MTTTNEILITRPIVTSRLLERESWLSYGFTSRIPGIDAADGNVSYSGGRNRAAAWTMRQAFLSADGLDPEAIVTTGQVHSNNVLRVEAADRGRGAKPDSEILGLADATMTREPGPVLFSLHADCLPILLADPMHRVVAVAHSGWRGTVADVAGRTIAAMATDYGSDPREIVAFLGPAISGAAYEVGPDVVVAWRNLHGDESATYWPGDADRWQFDTVTANVERLVRAGLRTDNIERSGICTFDSGAEWFSHRAQGPSTGRFAAYIAVR